MSLILTTIILLVFGLTILIRFSDIFVSAASSLSLSLKVPKMLIALTIAAFGTCAPELAISFNSIKSGASDMTLANVIGSCIVNILLIVGLSAITRPIKVKERTIKKELPLLVIITTAFFILVTDSLFKKSAVNSLSRADAIMLLIWFILFMFYIIGIVRKNKNNEYDIPEYSIVKSIILIILSLLAITLSSNIVVDNAVLLASQIGISQKIISMTINAARKDEFDMAVGNIIGTNIFNICIVLGLPIAIYGGVSSSSFNVVDTSVVLLSALMFYIFGRSNKELSRREGLLMVLVFILYYTYVFIS